MGICAEREREKGASATNVVNTLFSVLYEFLHDYSLLEIYAWQLLLLLLCLTSSRKAADDITVQNVPQLQTLCQ